MKNIFATVEYGSVVFFRIANWKSIYIYWKENNLRTIWNIFLNILLVHHDDITHKENQNVRADLDPNTCW